MTERASIQRTEDLSAAELDALIANLVARRASMEPSASAALGPDTPIYRADDLLWDIRPGEDGLAVQLSLYHPGLGWVAVRLSRAQVQAIENAFFIAMRDLPVHRNSAASSADCHDAGS